MLLCPINICFYIPFFLITTSCTLAGPFLTLWGKPQGFSFPTGRAANDKPAPRFQGAEAMADIPLVALEGAHQLLVATRDYTPGALGIGSQPAEDPFLELRETCGGHSGPLLACGERETGRRYPQGDKILLLHGGERARQLPVFSANNPPAHAHERGRKSLPGAGLRAGEGG
jgi:hypothetical protein